MFVYRVIYGDTDMMGVMYHSNYFRLFEIGRNELFRETGKTYRDLEEKNMYLPVKEAFCDYIRSAVYDDLISINCAVAKRTRTSIRFNYTLKREEEIIATGYTLHPYVSDKGRVLRLTEKTLEEFFGKYDEMD